MASYNLAKNLNLPPANLAHDPGARNDLLLAAAATTVNTDPNLAEKRVRFGSDSSDEITIHVREFELEATDNDQLENQEMHRSPSPTSSLADEGQVVQAVVEATGGIAGLPQGGDQSAPSSTSTAASLSNPRYPAVLAAGKVAGGRESHNQQYVQQPRRHNARYLNGGGGEGINCSMNWHQGAHEDPPLDTHYTGLREDFELPVEQYRWNEDFNQQNLMYAEISQNPPPPPPPRLRRPVYEPRSVSAFQRKSGGSYRRLSDVDEMDSHSAPAGPSQPDPTVLFKNPPPARAQYRAASTTEDIWRTQPLPQGVPLILGPNGQWKYYTAPTDQRNVVYDNQRGGWVSRPLDDCDCTSDHLCPKHRRRQMAPPMPQPEWSEADYETGDFTPYKLANTRGEVRNPVPSRRPFQHDGYGDPLTKPTTQPARYENDNAWAGENPHFRY